MFNGKIHYIWSFSIAMLNYQRVIIEYNTMGLGFYGQYTTIKKLGTSPTRSGEVADQGVRMQCTNVTQIPNFIPFLCGTCKVVPPQDS